MNDNQADIVWWNAFKDGDREAFEHLFRKYYPILTQYGSKVCSDPDLLEDTIQDLFVELWQSRSANPVQSIKAYFFKSLKYKLFRQFKNVRNSKQGQSLEGDSFTISHDHFLVQKEDEMMEARRVSDAINQLPARQKEIVYLKIYQGMSYEEVSEVMNINYQVARNLFYQSIKSLRSVFLK